MSGLFSNPADWQITDSLQGQEGGINPVKAALKYTTPIGVLDIAKDSLESTGFGSPNSTIDNPTGTLPATTTQPNVTQTNDFSNLGSGGYTGGTSGNSQDLAFVDSQSQLIDRLIASLTGQRANGVDNINTGYQSDVNKATEQRDRALNQYSTQRGDTINQKQQSIGKVDDYARQLANSVRQRIGLASGSNSSAYQYAAPNAIARDASGKRNDVLQNYAVNLRNLDQSETYAKNDFESLLQDYMNQKQDKMRQFDTGLTQQRQGLVSQRGDLAGEKARLTGAGYDGIRTAQQPYLNQYSQLNDKIGQFFQQYKNPVYQTRDVATQNPTLQDYTVDQTAVNANSQGGGSQYSPYANFLQKKKDQSYL